MGTFGQAVTMKVNRALNSGTTINSSCYGIAYYKADSVAQAFDQTAMTLTPIIKVIFGPGQTVAGTKSIPIRLNTTTLIYLNYSIFCGVEFINV
jgi:hypothetical protein